MRKITWCVTEENFHTIPDDAAVHIEGNNGMSIVWVDKEGQVHTEWFPKITNEPKCHAINCNLQ